MINIFDDIKKAILSSKTALVIAHVDPDGDTIGSMLATSLILKKLALKVTMLSEEGIPKIYKFLPHSDEVLRKISSKDSYDLVVTVDASDIKRVGAFINLRKTAKTIINIDHHSDNTMFGDINYVEQISSVAEQIYKLSKYLAISLDKDIATCLYTALITDTGNFRYENTTVSTFNFAAELIKAHVNTNEIAIKIYDTKTIPSLKILSLALNSIESSKDGKVVWTVVTKEMMGSIGATSEDLTGIIDHLRAIEGVEVAVLLREDEGGKVKLNLRSKEKINVQEIAKKLGGGGHIRAAGAILEGKIEDIKKKVINTVLDMVGSKK